MKNLYFAGLLAFLPLLSQGQISLNASMAPPVNSMIIYYDANVPSPPFTFSKSGINNTWDFASLFADPINDDTVYYMSPSSVPGSGAFPSATHANYEAGDADINMLQINSTSLSYLGIVGDPIGTGTPGPIAANPPAVTMNFPYTYGSSVNTSTYIQIYTTGAAIGQPTIDSVRYKSTLFLDANVIAAGNMVLPSGTMPSLLERRINTSIDTAWMKGTVTGNQWVMAPGFPQTTIDSSFNWYSDQSLQHYAHALYDDTGLHDVHYFKSQLTTGLNETKNSSASFLAYPNPAVDFLGVKGLKTPEATEWKVLDANGREVLKGNSTLQNLNIKNLNKGSYTLQFITPAGLSHQVRFIKN